MSYHDAERNFALLVQVQRYIGQQLIGDELSVIETERLKILIEELDRRFPDGE